ncbi:sensor histidine kinase [Paenibacillus lemnae]|uniref:histidine kinase n=1 Tax=Paenibacillus lemnae TaxID=1330551 RepID=A0A848MAY7_PAELE|nr:HAMP domain-containing sensor histidine kinase [Paenibacillus lemnae]NMO97361.1 HAMP domain-containing histidine kinase [Paenibacillus lemnae]
MSIMKKIMLIFGSIHTLISFLYMSLYVWHRENVHSTTHFWRAGGVYTGVILYLLGLVVIYAAAAISTRTYRKNLKRLEETSPVVWREQFEDGQRDEWGQLLMYIGHLKHLQQKETDTHERMLADAVHEMRTPLSVIQSRAESMVEGTIPCRPEELIPLLDETSRLGRLIHDLKELSLAESGKLRLNGEWVDFAGIVRGVWELLGHEAEAKGISCSISLQEAKVYCDRQRMEQVLVNLIGNAVNYTPEQGSITVECRVRSFELQFMVRNSGEGIPLEHLPYVFDRFYRSDRSRQRAGGGMGLGLSIAKHYVEAHEGKISVDSNSGEGAEFVFSMPLFPAS